MQCAIILKSSPGYKWIPWSVNDGLPPRALPVGHEKDGTPIYVGRKRHHDCNVPVKIVPSREFASICDQRREIMVQSFDVLVGDGFDWVRSGGGHVPDGAISCGQSSTNRPIFIGRANHKDSLIPGQVDPRDGRLIIPYEGGTVAYKYYDVLVNRFKDHGDLEDNSGSDDDDEDDCSLFGDPALPISEYRSDRNLCWAAAINSQPPPEGAIVAGYDSDGSTIYVGRVMYEGNQLPAKVIPKKHLCHTQFNGAEIEMSSYEALCFGNVSWVRFRGTIPPNALVCGQTTSGEKVYIGRGYYLNSLTPGRVFASEKVLYLPHSWKEHRITDFQILVDEDCVTPQALQWIHTKREQPAPEGALKVGQDRDGADIYLGRVQHDGNRYVGKVIPSKQICDTTHDMKVISKLAYEAFCVANVSWIPFAGTFPNNAVECGRTSGGEKVYIGRCNVKSELIPGTVLCEEKKLRIAYDQDEIVCDEFELLVFDHIQP